VSVVEGGTLQAVNEISIRNDVEGTSRIIYIVPEGSYVEKGDLLVELDSMQAQDAVNQQQINFEKAQFALIQAENQLAIQRSQVESEVRAAELKCNSPSSIWTVTSRVNPRSTC
jgi:HlyD family secretion protein